jgi:ATP-dependent DNA helicase PIF1
MESRTILASTNKRVDFWNEEVQKLNVNPMETLISADVFDEVDDPHHIIRNMIGEDFLNNYNANNIPPHVLNLKVNDICLVLRTISKTDKLSTNTRVQIDRISRYVIRVKTLGTPAKFITLPRIRFRFKLPYGHSYYMLRTQFPLRLAYCMSLNKSQGQEFSKVLMDITEPSFSHGHTYVGLSRIHHFKDIGFFCTDTQILQRENENPCPIFTNIVYKDLRQKFEHNNAMNFVAQYPLVAGFNEHDVGDHNNPNLEVINNDDAYVDADIDYDLDA